MGEALHQALFVRHILIEILKKSGFPREIFKDFLKDIYLVQHDINMLESYIWQFKNVHV